MSQVCKVVSLAGAMLLAAAGIALAVDPSKLPPSKTRTVCGVNLPCPDLVPLVNKFTCSGQYLHMTLGVKNQGIAKTTVAFKTLVKINGQIYANQDNPHVTAAPMWPGQWQEFHIDGLKPVPQGPYVLEMEVDYEKTQPESNENNNVANVTCQP